MERYLLGSLGLAWSVLGVSWAATIPVFAVFYAAAIAVTYGLLRQLMGKVLAVAGSIFWLFNAIHLSILPNLRDYSKMPFMLGAILIMAYLVRRPVSRRVLLAWSALAGVLVGFGLGFRVDMIVIVPAFAAVVLFFLPGSMRQTVLLRLSAVTVFCALFLIVGWPILSVLEGGSNTYHVLIYGLTKTGHRLGLSDVPYEYLYRGGDQHNLVSVDAYAYCRTGTVLDLSLGTPLYDQWSNEYLVNIVRHFPADMLTRSYAAMLQILGLPFTPLMWAEHYDPRLLGFLIGGLALLLLSRHSLRIALFALFILVYHIGYTGVYFAGRQYFHLQIISLLLLGFLLQQVISMIGRSRNRPAGSRVEDRLLPLRRWWSPAAKRMVGFGLGSLLFLSLPLVALRWYQQVEVGKLLKQYADAQLESLDVTYSRVANNKVLIEPARLMKPVALDAPDAPDRSYLEYLVVEIDPNAVAPGTIVPVTFRYERAPFKWDETKQIRLGEQADVEPGAPARMYVTVFRRPQFLGVEIPKSLQAAVKLYRVKDSCQFPLLLAAKLPHDWQSLNLYQQIDLRLPLMSAPVEDSAVD